MTTVTFEPASPLSGELRPPPDKSVSHRAALLGAMAEGPTRITGYLDSADTRATLRAVAAVGAEVREGQADEHGGLFVELEGVGLRGPRSAEIDVGNAGTLLRIMPGWLAGQADGEWEFDGDESIRRRPVDRVADPLRLSGGEGRLPRWAAAAAPDPRCPAACDRLRDAGGERAGEVLPPARGLLAQGETTIHEPVRTRDHTERILAAAGAAIRRDDDAITIAPAERLEGGDIPVPGDFSSAAFFLVAALLVPGSEMSLREVGINRNRIGLLSILSRMGVDMGGAHGDHAITIHEIREPGPEPVATLDVRHAELAGVEVGAEDVPAAIDELPLVALLGCFADGETVVSGAEELRAKESDRIASVVEGLAGLGAEIEARPDGFAVRGSRGLRGGTIDARGDHRLAMLGAIAGLASREGVEVTGFDAVAVSYPRFERDLRSLIG